MREGIDRWTGTLRRYGIEFDTQGDVTSGNAGERFPDSWPVGAMP